MAYHDWRLHGLVIGTFPIPLGGTGEAARIAFGELGAVDATMGGHVKRVPNAPSAVLTVTVLATDPARAILDKLARAMYAAPAVLYPGSAVQADSSARTCGWADCHILTIGDQALGSENPTITYTFGLIGVVF